ncbi:protein of unknown function [Caldanaerobius fijiensis DSM 17918]|uniref:Uncharacterized protein n=1 Tax=Caldanaerobius fijiensis DSM 17918 TaxID=1121256 RepID=A0A1M5EK68_9THEO|nr:Druantia anti-phage system protein DruA [Caldanaerobius fijiensis]SHF79703.1 protein of unknown function [Caldanaerobius fijiensis DSM 17918]
MTEVEIKESNKNDLGEKIKLEIIQALINAGFLIDISRASAESSNAYKKEYYRRLQSSARLEKIRNNAENLLKYFNKAIPYIRDAKDIDPQKIDIEFVEVKGSTNEEKIFRFWNYIWWSIPYERAYGRQMRFLLYDKYHNSFAGLIYLQSPILKMSARDEYLEIPKDELDLWINMSMQAQRLGALPPYNEFIGGKLAALVATSNEVRELYKLKYSKVVTEIKKRKIGSQLLFLTTTSAFGKSSIYNRLKYRNEPAAISVGYTKGYGTFQFPDELYEKILLFLKGNGIDISRGYGYGPSRKLRLISKALNMLGLSDVINHGIKREVFLFPLVSNLKEVIKYGDVPRFYNRHLNDIVEFWKERWAVPRALRKPAIFSSKKFIEETREFLKCMNVKG